MWLLGTELQRLIVQSYNVVMAVLYASTLWGMSININIIINITIILWQC